MGKKRIKRLEKKIDDVYELLNKIDINTGCIQDFTSETDTNVEKMCEAIDSINDKIALISASLHVIYTDHIDSLNKKKQENKNESDSIQTT